jgi:hypothetical protein
MVTLEQEATNGVLAKTAVGMTIPAVLRQQLHCSNTQYGDSPNTAYDPAVAFLSAMLCGVQRVQGQGINETSARRFVRRRRMLLPL